MEMKPLANQGQIITEVDILVHFSNLESKTSENKSSARPPGTFLAYFILFISVAIKLLYLSSQIVPTCPKTANEQIHKFLSCSLNFYAVF